MNPSIRRRIEGTREQERGFALGSLAVQIARAKAEGNPLTQEEIKQLAVELGL
jgi:hypothetical protein